MENCNQRLTMHLECSCHSGAPQSSSQGQEEGADLRPLYQKFARTLQCQLRKLSAGYIEQIDTLNGQIFSLKNTVQRLQIRNKKDGEAERQLRREYNILQQKLKDKVTAKGAAQVQIVERVKEVRVDTTDPALPLEVARWRQKYEEALQLHLKAKAEREAAETAKQDLIEEIERLQTTIGSLKNQLEQAKRRDGAKQQQIQKLQSHIQFLKNNKEVVVETRHFFPDFKPVQRVRPQTKIETVYVERPVEKVVVLQVERRVKEFIQPERPLVNRIISCEPKEDCRCKEEGDYGTSARSDQVQHLNEVVSRLQSNIRQYKNERQRLVHVIDDRNRELNSLQTHLRLVGRGDTYHRGPSTVNVTVTKLEEDRPISQKMTRVVEQEQTRATQARRR